MLGIKTTTKICFNSPNLKKLHWDYFAPMRLKRTELAADPTQVDAVLATGAEKARDEAAIVLDRVRKAVGLI